jgi:hypothetical protein
MGHVGKNEEIFWQTIYDFQPYAMSIYHKDLVRKGCKAQRYSSWKMSSSTSQQVDITLAVNTRKIMLIILFYVTSRISKWHKINSISGRNNKWNPATMLCYTGDSSKNLSQQPVVYQLRSNSLLQQQLYCLCKWIRGLSIFKMRNTPFFVFSARARNSRFKMVHVWGSKSVTPSPLDSGTVVPAFAVRIAGLQLLRRCRLRFTSVSLDESSSFCWLVYL